nr:stage III sporulation protein AE [uncultured Blautia sp.]
MRRGKKILLFFTVCFLSGFSFLGTVTEVSAASDRSAEEEEQEKQNEQEISLEEEQQKTQTALLEDLELGQMQEAVNELLGEESFQVREILVSVIREGRLFTKEGAKEIISASLSSHLSLQKKTLVEILLLVLLAALFANFSSAFGKGQTGEVSFYVVYLFLLVLLLRSFGNMGTELTESLKGLVFFTKALIPSYFLAVTAATGSVSAMVFYEMVFLVIYLVQTVLLKVILPGIEAYVLISMVNFLQKEDLLSRMAELFKTLLEWGLNACTAVVIGMQVIQNMISPTVDTLKRDMLGKAAAALPGIGNAIDGVTEVALGTAVLIRNALGVLGISILLLLGLAPLLRLGLSTLLYKLLAAVVQPVSDRRITGCLQAVGDGCRLLLRTLFTAELMLFITIAVLTVSFGGH